MSQAPQPIKPRATHKHPPFRRALLRGLGIVLPPLLTIVVFIWVWNAIERNVLMPVEGGARQTLTWLLPKPFDAPPPDAELSHVAYDEKGGVQSFVYQNTPYVRLSNGKQWIPAYIRDEVEGNFAAVRDSVPTTARQYYRAYITQRYLRRVFVIPVFLLVFVLVLYMLGKFVAYGVGRLLWNSFEGLIHRVPIIRNVYSSVKQITDYLFNEQQVHALRVIAVEYPRRGIWSLGFVTGEGFLDIRNVAKEPVLSILIPTSPMPATGFTITARKSETIDLNISMDEAVQFIVSCGVAIPPHQHSGDAVRQEMSRAVAERVGTTAEDN